MNLFLKKKNGSGFIIILATKEITNLYISNKMKKLLKTFLNQKNIEIKKADGIYFYDSKGKKYTDLTGGYTGHAILGWGNKEIQKAIYNQAKKYCHIDYKFFSDPNRERLANLLLAKSKHLNKFFEPL